MNEDVRIRGYFSKPEGARKQIRLGNAELKEDPLARNTDCRFGRTEILRCARSAVECWKVGARFEKCPFIQTRTKVCMIQYVDLRVTIRFAYVRRPVQIPGGSAILRDFSHNS